MQRLVFWWSTNYRYPDALGRTCFARTCVVDDRAGAGEAGGLRGVVGLFNELTHDGKEVRELLIQILLVELECAGRILATLRPLRRARKCYSSK